MQSSRPLKIILVVSIFIIMLAVHLIFIHESRYNTLALPDDVYFVWLEGNRILHGENPYARILGSDMRTNEKYATYLPGSYLLSAAMQLSGQKTYQEWLSVWRGLMEVFYLGCGLALMTAVGKRLGAAMMIFAGAFWFLGRWSLAVVPIAHAEPMAIGFMVIGWMLYPKHRIAGLMLFSCSLAVKQIAVFLVPLFLIQEWLHSSEVRLQKKLIRASAALGFLLLIPFLLSFPFLIWNFKGFFLSVLFSATREGTSHFGANSIDVVVGMQGLAARIPMLAMMALVYLGFYLRKIDRDWAALLTMSVFIQFNSVLFVQYLMWSVPFLILAIGQCQEAPFLAGTESTRCSG